jgi:hypothetical protein
LNAVARTSGAANSGEDEAPFGGFVIVDRLRRGRVDGLRPTSVDAPAVRVEEGEWAAPEMT